MDLTIPHGKISELLLYAWKIINLPFISEQELLYQLSFNLTLLTPEKAKIFLNDCVKKNLLVKNTINQLKISETVLEDLNLWQLERKKSLTQNMKGRMLAKTTIKQINNNKSSDFGILLKSFSEKSVLNRAISVPDDAFQNVDFNPKKEKIFANVRGSKNILYKIDIDLSKKSLKHDCHDFIERKSKQKKFCKHLTKFILLMKVSEEKAILALLEKISSEINDWEFSGF